MQQTVGSRFKKIRKILNLSQEQLASFLEITKQAVSNIENSKSMPSIATMNKLSLQYNINLNFLISGIGDVYINKEKDYKTLRESLLQEVDIFLKARGI